MGSNIKQLIFYTLTAALLFYLVYMVYIVFSGMADIRRAMAACKTVIIEEITEMRYPYAIIRADDDKHYIIGHSKFKTGDSYCVWQEWDPVDEQIKE